MAVYFDPRLNSGGGMGNLSAALGLYDQFLGTGSKIRSAQLQDATNSVQLHANELAKSNLDRQTTEGSLTSFGQAPAALRKPTTDMNPDEYQQWFDLHKQNGVKDFDGAAGAWNRTMFSNFGKAATPQGGLPTEFGSDASGMRISGVMIPPGIQQPPAPSGQPAPQPSAAPAPAPAPGAAQPVGSPQIPNLTPAQMFSPTLRQVHQYQLETAGKEQELAKGQREAMMGTPEEQKTRRDFSTSAAELSHNLAGLEDTVKKFGNAEWWDEKGNSKLNLLPKQIAENWKHINNPGGGPLKPGQEDKAAESLIPMPGTAGVFSPVRNSMTLSAINDNRQLLAAKVKEYENDPATRLPVLGLDPGVRSLVGMPPQRLVDNLQAQGNDPSSIQGAPAGQQGPQQFSSMQELMSADQSGKTDRSQPATINGTIYDPVPGVGWVPRSAPPTDPNANSLPPINLTRSRAPQ